MKILSLCLVLAIVASAQETLTNAAVVKMVKGGLGEDVIVSAIQSRPGAYDLSSDQLVTLKQQGLGDKVLAAMLAKGSSAPATSAVAPTPVRNEGKLPYIIAHVHVPSYGNHIRDFGSMFVTVDGIEFRGTEHSFKWGKDEIAEINNANLAAHSSFNLVKVDQQSEAVKIKLKGQSQQFYFVACGDPECKGTLFPYVRKPGPTELYDIVLRQLGRN